MHGISNTFHWQINTPTQCTVIYFKISEFWIRLMGFCKSSNINMVRNEILKTARNMDSEGKAATKCRNESSNLKKVARNKLKRIKLSASR